MCVLATQHALMVLCTSSMLLSSEGSRSGRAFYKRLLPTTEGASIRFVLVAVGAAQQNAGIPPPPPRHLV